MSERIVALPQGLTVRRRTHDLDPDRRRSACGWGSAPATRPRELAGVSHFLEHLLFKGTESRSAIDISQTVDRVGGDINAFTSKEYTAYYCRCPGATVGDGYRVARRRADVSRRCVTTTSRVSVR